MARLTAPSRGDGWPIIAFHEVNRAMHWNVDVKAGPITAADWIETFYQWRG